MECSPVLKNNDNQHMKFEYWIEIKLNKYYQLLGLSLGIHSDFFIKICFQSCFLS